VEIAIIIGGGNLWRGAPGCGARHGTEHRRPHGYDRHCDERSGAPGRA
jgi:hypothetical protein